MTDEWVPCPECGATGREFNLGYWTGFTHQDEHQDEVCDFNQEVG